MTVPRIGIATAAFANIPDLAADFAGTAEIDAVDLSDPAAVARTTVGIDGVVVTLQRLSADIIEAFAPTVRVIGRAGVGLDTIDLDCAARSGVGVVNQPAYGAPEVASHAIAMLLALQRRLGPSDTFVRQGWAGALALGRIKPIDEMRIAVVGGGRIGRAFIDGIRPLVGEIVVYDPGPVDLPDGVQRAADLRGALTGADALSLHVPLTGDTRDLIGSRELGLLAAGALVINVARGGIIDEAALARALHEGRIGGAGLDVFDQEPLPRESPLLKTPNTILTPHSASTSERAQYRLSHWTIADSIQYLTSGTVTHGSIVVAPAARGSGVTATQP